MTPVFDLSGKTVIVTGASSGIGRATSVLLSRQGAKLILVGRDQKRLNETHQLLYGGGHIVEVFDMLNIDLIPTWMQGLAEKFGSIGGVVHCAGIQHVAPVRAVSVDMADKLFRVNVFSGLMLAKGLRQRTVKGLGSSLVFVSSVMGIVGAPCRAIYCASKGAVISMTKALAVELAGEGVRVNCVAPAFVRTKMLDELESIVAPDQLDVIRAKHPLGFGIGDDVGNAILYLLASESRWVTGSVMTVDGGYTAQ
jgi:NAD(P)-dependent dehydrogenase (short-subunit alcohol dehydrogenase family)